VCVRGLRRLRLDDRRGAVVFGDGPIGLLALMLLRRAGMRRLGLVGGRPGRLALARALGADWTVDYHAAGDGLASAVRAAAPDAPMGNLLETSGSDAALAAAFAVAPPGAKILVLGDYGATRASFLWNEILHREIELIGSNASAGAWPEAVRLAQEADFPLERLVTHRLPAARFAEGVELVRNRNSGAIKVILEWV
jgi:threonine dehydrogenase-like Zn-dependent dehydrogenase